ncbi:MAG: uracil-DNA glycosylase [SAR202 cluster bacterium]|nr:uracil-DNA glycosylase [SAR202 cluster bacterium]
MSEVAAVAQRIRACVDCPLSHTRTQAVPGEGPEAPPIMFVGEGPGFNEDQQGRPFVGPAGRLLEELLAAIGMRREQVFITNVVKCRPPENRDPFPSEIQACKKYLDHQIKLLDPQIVATLGRYSLSHFFPQETISRVHGRAKQAGGVLVYPLYHPAAALRSPAVKRELLQDFKRLPSLLVDYPRKADPARAAPSTTEASTQQMKLF